MTKQPITIVPRLEAGKSPILFLPSEPAQRGRIAVYSAMDEHGEADVGYYATTKPVTGSEADFLIERYRQIPGGDNRPLKVLTRRPAKG